MEKLKRGPEGHYAAAQWVWVWVERAESSPSSMNAGAWPAKIAIGYLGDTAKNFQHRTMGSADNQAVQMAATRTSAILQGAIDRREVQLIAGADCIILEPHDDHWKVRINAEDPMQVIRSADPFDLCDAALEAAWELHRRKLEMQTEKLSAQDADSKEAAPAAICIAASKNLSCQEIVSLHNVLAITAGDYFRLAMEQAILEVCTPEQQEIIAQKLRDEFIKRLKGTID